MERTVSGMSKSVLMSVKPKWCELIASGKKTIEIRKSRPKLETPFKCYIYCTREEHLWKRNNIVLLGSTYSRLIDELPEILLNGRVIGEFVCDRVETFRVFGNGSIQNFFCEKLEQSCLSYDEISKYVGSGRDGYAWHISELKIYDEPKELNDFCIPCAEFEKDYPKCRGCECYYFESNESIGFYDECASDGVKPIKRPPQSWCYVEEIENDH